MKLYMFRTVPLSIIRNVSLYTQQWYTSHKFVDSLRAGSGRNCCFVLILLYDIYHRCVYSEKLLMMDRRTVRNVQSFIPKNKFEKLVHIVDFIIGIYRDARPPESQITYFVQDNQIQQTTVCCQQESRHKITLQKPFGKCRISARCKNKNKMALGP